MRVSNFESKIIYFGICIGVTDFNSFSCKLWPKGISNIAKTVYVGWDIAIPGLNHVPTGT